MHIYSNRHTGLDEMVSGCSSLLTEAVEFSVNINIILNIQTSLHCTHVHTSEHSVLLSGRLTIIQHSNCEQS